MKPLSEQHIKKQLGQREIEPSKTIWDNIQKELDQNQKPKKRIVWLKYAGIAAVLAIGFLVYQTLKPIDNQTIVLVLDSKSVITKPVKFEPTKLDYVAKPQMIKNESENNLVQNQIKVDKQKSNQTSEIEIVETTIDDEIENLLQLANIELEKAEQERRLTEEVNTLLAQAIEDTDDIEQKEILKTLEAEVLLAEVESEIKFEKPQNLKDKIWEVLVTNLNDIKRSVALN